MHFFPHRPLADQTKDSLCLCFVYVLSCMCFYQSKGAHKKSMSKTKQSSNTKENTARNEMKRKPQPAVRGPPPTELPKSMKSGGGGGGGASRAGSIGMSTGMSTGIGSISTGIGSISTVIGIGSIGTGSIGTGSSISTGIVTGTGAGADTNGSPGDTCGETMTNDIQTSLKSEAAHTQSINTNTMQKGPNNAHQTDDGWVPRPLKRENTAKYNTMTMPFSQRTRTGRTNTMDTLDSFAEKKATVLGPPPLPQNPPPSTLAMPLTALKGAAIKTSTQDKHEPALPLTIQRAKTSGNFKTISIANRGREGGSMLVENVDKGSDSSANESPRIPSSQYQKVGLSSPCPKVAPPPPAIAPPNTLSPQRAPSSGLLSCENSPRFISPDMWKTVLSSGLSHRQIELVDDIFLKCVSLQQACMNTAVTEDSSIQLAEQREQTLFEIEKMRQNNHYSDIDSLLFFLDKAQHLLEKVCIEPTNVLTRLRTPCATESAGASCVSNRLQPYEET